MQTDELDARELDYWTARALARDDLPASFVQIEPKLVATFSTGDATFMDAYFAPSAGWADAACVLERLDTIRTTRLEDGRTRCVARFVDGETAEPSDSHGTGAGLRTALLRAFVRARFGDSVEAMPCEPHEVHRGVIKRHDAGEAVPPVSRRRDAPTVPNAIGSLPRQ